MILADTSAWVEYDRGTGSAVDRRLSALIATAPEASYRHTAGMGYVDVQKLSCVLPDGRVLFDDVSFRVGEGAKTALVGANGTGKTTLLRMIAGDVQPASGAVARTGGLGPARRPVAARPARSRHEANPRAITAYARLGFVDTGERRANPLEPGGLELVMALRLAAS